MVRLMPIIVLYKKSLSESETYNSLLNNKDVNLLIDRVIVYDNSPNPQYIIDTKFNVSYYHDSTNSGISKAYNYGFVKAKEFGKNWIIFLDQDTTLDFNLISSYYRAINNNHNMSLFAPILKVGELIFSPSLYKLKRGFSHTNALHSGIYNLNAYVPVNSGICVKVEAFEEAGGYNEKIPLDFSDFDFIERFKKKINEYFYVIDVKCEQRSSNDVNITIESSASRFKYYCIGGINYRNTFTKISDRLTVLGILLFRTLRLSIRFKSLVFLNIFVKYILRNT